MTDIVERLREGTRGADITKTDVVLNAIMSEAADEIERLRKALKEIAEPRRGYEWRMRIALEALGDN